MEFRSHRLVPVHNAHDSDGLIDKLERNPGGVKPFAAPIFASHQVYAMVKNASRCVGLCLALASGRIFNCIFGFVLTPSYRNKKFFSTRGLPSFAMNSGKATWANIQLIGLLLKKLLMSSSIATVLCSGVDVVLLAIVGYARCMSF